MYLEYADATEVAEVLTRVMQNLRDSMTRPRPTRAANAAKSTIEADEGTNSLIITADTDEMAALEAVIAELDIRRAQVLVKPLSSRLTSPRAESWGSSGCLPTTLGSTAAT